jgi:purine-binding chemotaxis protein CheW
VTAADTAAVLARRAELLARPRDDADQPGATLEVLLVEAGDGQRYALPASQVREVQRAEHLRRVPAGAGAVLGVIPVRSAVVPVVDLAAVLGTSPVDRTRPFVVVVEDGETDLALLVDGVVDVTAWDQTDVRTTPTMAGDGGTGAGARVGPGGVLLLDAAALLRSPAAGALRVAPGFSDSDRRHGGPRT